MVPGQCVTSLIVTALGMVHTISAMATGDARLSGGTEAKGRVEIWDGRSRRWGTVCDDLWNLDDGDVVCKQLGYLGAYRVFSGFEVGRVFGWTNLDIFLDDLQCEGNEPNLFQCQRNRGQHNCNPNERAGVECILTTDIRLVMRGRANDRVGHVEVAINGEWGKVCDDGWNERSATVVCRQLGRSLISWNPSLREAFTDVRYVIDDVDCRGDEAQLLDCGRRELWYNNCADNEVASVICG